MSPLAVDAQGGSDDWEGEDVSDALADGDGNLVCVVCICSHILPLARILIIILRPDCLVWSPFFLLLNLFPLSSCFHHSLDSVDTVSVDSTLSIFVSPSSPISS